jgi:hypothetical protein
MENDNDSLLVPIVSGPGGVGARLGGIGRTKIYELIGHGELTRVRIGRRTFVTAESLVAYVDRIAEKAMA